MPRGSKDCDLIVMASNSCHGIVAIAVRSETVEGLDTLHDPGTGTSTGRLSG